MARYSGKGWHFQHTRHSNARKYGHAGGTYAMRYEKSGFFKGEPILVKQTNNPSRVEIYSKHTGKGFADKKHIMRTTSKKHYGSSYELEPRYDSRKSFYGKARVEIEDGNKKLYSYNTLVAEIKDGRAIVHGTYSQTTLRHIKEFLKQEGFKAETSKQMIKDYPEKVTKRQSENKLKWKSISEAPITDIEKEFKQAYGRLPTSEELQDIIYEGEF